MLGHGPIAGRPLSEAGPASSLPAADGGFYSLTGLPLGVGAPGGAPPPEVVPHVRRKAPSVAPDLSRPARAARITGGVAAYVPPARRPSRIVTVEIERRARLTLRPGQTDQIPSGIRRPPQLRIDWQTSTIRELAVEGEVVVPPGDTIPYLRHTPPALTFTWTLAQDGQVAVEGEAAPPPAGDTIPYVRHTPPALAFTWTSSRDGQLTLEGEVVEPPPGDTIPATRSARQALPGAPDRPRAARRLTPVESFVSIETDLPGAYEGLTLVEAVRRRAFIVQGAVAVAGDTIPYVRRTAPSVRIDWAVRVEGLVSLEGETVAAGDAPPALRHVAPDVERTALTARRGPRLVTPVESFLSVDVSLPSAFEALTVLWPPAKRQPFTAGAAVVAGDTVPAAARRRPSEIETGLRIARPRVVPVQSAEAFVPAPRALRVTLAVELGRVRARQAPIQDVYTQPALRRARRVDAPELFRRTARTWYTPERVFGPADREERLHADRRETLLEVKRRNEWLAVSDRDAVNEAERRNPTLYVNRSEGT